MTEQEILSASIREYVRYVLGEDCLLLQSSSIFEGLTHTVTEEGRTLTVKIGSSAPKLYFGQDITSAAFPYYNLDSSIPLKRVIAQAILLERDTFNVIDRNIFGCKAANFMICFAALIIQIECKLIKLENVIDNTLYESLESYAGKLKELKVKLKKK